MRGVQLPFRTGTDLLAVGELRSTTSSIRDCDSSKIPKRYTGARDTTFARSAGNNWIPKHTYIQTVSEDSVIIDTVCC